MRDAARRAALAFATLLLTVLMIVGVHAPEACAARRAFIVGNSSYASAPHLPNPANDARDLAQRLEGLDYQVTLLVDARRSAFLQAYQAFIASLRPDDLALLYFAGHGLQIGGENYLFPIDASVDSEADAKSRLVPLNALLADLSRASRTRIVILDACRNNPFGDKLAEEPATRSAGLSRGLARVYAGVGSFIAYSTQPGNVALDGRGRNSPFTDALLRHMAEPGADVHAVMRRVRADVQRTTSEQQVPWENSSLVDEVAFHAGGVSPSPAPRATASSPTDQTAALPRTPVPARSYAYVSGLDPNGDNFLALRTNPTATGVRIATLGPDTLLEVLEQHGVWRRVALLDGTTGWAHGNWIKCCRTVAVARPSAPQAAVSAPPSPPPRQQAFETCDSLWHRRNAVWHRNGYCFTTARGQQAFGNRGCPRNEPPARAAMPPADLAEIQATTDRERQLGCR